MPEFVPTYSHTRAEILKAISWVIVGGWSLLITYSVLVGDAYLWLHLSCFVVILVSILLPSSLMNSKHFLLFLPTFVIGIVEILTEGATGIEVPTFAMLIFLVAMTRGTRWAIATLAVCIASMMFIAYLIIEQHISIDESKYVLSNTWVPWILRSIVLSILALTAVAMYSILIRNLLQTVESSKALIAELSEEVDTRNEMERRLLESQNLYQMLAENVKDYVWTTDLEFNPTYGSPSVFHQRGYTVEEAMNQTLEETITEDMVEDTAKMFQQEMEHVLSGEIAQDETRMFEYKVKCKDGSEKWVESMLTILYEEDEPVAVLGVTRDISERKAAEFQRAALEQQMLQVQKMESLGLLAGGIAHDFNNLLVGILGNVDLARTKLPDDSPAKDCLDNSIANAKRAAELCQQLLAYSGRGKFLVEPTNMGQLVSETSKLLEITVPKTIKIVYQIEENLPLTDVDATQLRQVIMNLVINASDAIGSKEGNITISIRSENLTSDELESGSSREHLPKGSYVVVEIKDTGCGMETETLENIFDPFFTTKEMGYGLGLAAVLGIVHGHSGTLIVDSTPGQGTTFKVILPCSKNGKLSTDSPSEIQTTNDVALQTILIVDDDPQIRGLLKNVVESKEIKAIEAENGQIALDILQDINGAVDLVILDLTMPVLNGEETYREIRRHYPDLPVVISSGYSASEHLQHFGKDEALQFLQKPYQMSELMAVLNLATRK